LLFFDWIERRPDPLAIDRYLSLRHVPAPLTMFSSIKKLEPASMFLWEEGRLAGQSYWRPSASRLRPYDIEAARDFKDLLTDAVRLRLQSDVPLGVYLSGGVDSAAVAGLMKVLDDGPRVSYTVGFDYEYDEHPRAQRLARHLNYEYNPLTVTQDDFELMPRLTYHLDEPLGDLLGLPAYLLARKAKEKLTVVLTGDGADEILNGYFHQRLMVKRQNSDAFLAAPGAAAFLSQAVKAVPAPLLNLFFDYPDRLGPREKLKLSQAVAKSPAFGSFYEGVTSCFSAQDKAQLCGPDLLDQARSRPLADEFQAEMDSLADFSLLARLSLMDIKYHLPFSLIGRLDKLNMAHAVETRSPFLDFRVVEMALNLADEGKLNPRRNKEVLRRLIEELYPPQFRERTKQAFYMPLIGSYLDRFRQWTADLLSPESIAGRGLFRWPYVARQFDLSRRGSMLASRQLTALAMLELWHRVFVDSAWPPAGIV
ncbi:MAG: hypothetical protein JRJ59_07230, partial [Deltaproteobacteria bacterium]|nr:hypothetical protein [Deltaproteobacteria bacterium]